MLAYTNSRLFSVSTHQREFQKLWSSKHAFASMYASAARNFVVFWQIQTSGLLSQVGYISKLSRIYLDNRPRRCTTATPSHGGIYNVACTLTTEALARTKLNFHELLAKIRNFTSVESISILCIFLPTCPNPSHVHPIEMFLRLVHHDFLPLPGINIGVYWWLAESRE